MEDTLRCDHEPVSAADNIHTADSMQDMRRSDVIAYSPSIDRAGQVMNIAMDDGRRAVWMTNYPYSASVILRMDSITKIHFRNAHVDLVGQIDLALAIADALDCDPPETLQQADVLLSSTTKYISFLDDACAQCRARIIYRLYNRLQDVIR